MNETLRSVNKALSKMVLDPRFIFLSSLALRLRVSVTDAHDTCATDGRYLYVNPKFWRKLSSSEQIGVLAHEVLHCVLGHPRRRGARRRVHPLRGRRRRSSRR